MQKRHKPFYFYRIYQKKWWLIAGFLAISLLASCSLFDNLIGKKDNKDEDLMKLLMLGLLVQQPPASAQCENKSGFVICIPKGVTFQ